VNALLLHSVKINHVFNDGSCAKMSAELETAMYAPYVKASNCALDYMRQHSVKFERKLELRPPSSLNLRFHRNDPKILQTQYPGTEETVKRKPDVITTSKVAADDHVDSNSSYHEPPSQSFQWPDVLSCHEFKLGKNPNKDQLLDNYTAERQQSYPADASEVTTPVELTPEDDNGAARKRALEVPDASPSDPASKKPRVEQRSAGGKKSGTKSQSKVPSNSQTAMPNDRATIEVMKNPQKQRISPRAQCAMYGMEMLSHTFGTHHAITVLIHGER
jgi:hypothetical protein